MLLIAKRIRDLSFSKLMEVYEEGNLENGSELYPNLSAGEQLLRAEQDFYQYLNEIFFATPGAVYLIYTQQQRYCAALRLEPYKDGLLLEALETAPALRRKGYAAALLREMKVVLTQQGGGSVYSHVSKRNEASLRAHLGAGFEKVVDYAVYADGSVLHNLYTLRLEL